MLEEQSGGILHYADDSLPHELDSTWAGGVTSWRCQPVPRVHLMLEGEHTVTLVRNGKPRTALLSPGDIWFLPSDAHDNEMFHHSCYYIAVIFHSGFTRFVSVKNEVPPADAASGKRTAQIVRRTWMLHWQEERPAILGNVLETLSLTLRDPAAAPLRESAGKHLAHALWLLICNWVEHAGARKKGGSALGKAHSSWQKLDRYLQENYHRPLNRKSASQVLGLHPNRISALCTQFAGKSFQKILEERRLKQSMRFLEKTDHSVESVSALCGYVSAAYFSRAFRRATGVTPGAWRIKPPKDKDSIFSDTY